MWTRRGGRITAAYQSDSCVSLAHTRTMHRRTRTRGLNATPSSSIAGCDFCATLLFPRGSGRDSKRLSDRVRRKLLQINKNIQRNKLTISPHLLLACHHEAPGVAHPPPLYVRGAHIKQLEWTPPPTSHHLPNLPDSVKVPHDPASPVVNIQFKTCDFTRSSCEFLFLQD